MVRTQKNSSSKAGMVHKHQWLKPVFLSWEQTEYSLLAMNFQNTAQSVVGLLTLWTGLYLKKYINFIFLFIDTKNRLVHQKILIQEEGRDGIPMNPISVFDTSHRREPKHQSARDPIENAKLYCRSTDSVPRRNHMASVWGLSSHSGNPERKYLFPLPDNSYPKSGREGSFITTKTVNLLFALVITMELLHSARVIPCVVPCNFWSQRKERKGKR